MDVSISVLLMVNTSLRLRGRDVLVTHSSINSSIRIGWPVGGIGSRVVYWIFVFLEL